MILAAPSLSAPRGILCGCHPPRRQNARVLPHHLQNILSFHQASGPGFFPTSLSAVLQGAMAAKPYAIIGLGMLLLILTLIVRVALSALFVLALRDWLYVGITLFVLAVLTFSLFSGIG
jgi:uncharacterized membrane protein